jgi:STE24 endopeptidase
LLTDALVDNLTPHQVEAVFGHEVGHIAHRHLSYFGFFFLGSVGVMALVQVKIQDYLNSTDLGTWLTQLLGGSDSMMTLAAQATVVLSCLALYFLVVFGYLSRRFERQADVFGCRTVSCGRLACPPHLDLNASPEGEGEEKNTDLCPAGIRIFASALADVAALNGMERESWWAWRHGSIARRIAFLEALEGRPEAERKFQRGVRTLRLGLAVVLASAVFFAAYTGALDRLH